jgi:hypothetical protein
VKSRISKKNKEKNILHSEKKKKETLSLLFASMATKTKIIQTIPLAPGTDGSTIIGQNTAQTYYNQVVHNQDVYDRLFEEIDPGLSLKDRYNSMASMIRSQFLLTVDALMNEYESVKYGAAAASTLHSQVPLKIEEIIRLHQIKQNELEEQKKIRDREELLRQQEDSNSLESASQREFIFRVLSIGNESEIFRFQYENMLTKVAVEAEAVREPSISTDEIRPSGQEPNQSGQRIDQTIRETTPTIVEVAIMPTEPPQSTPEGMAIKIRNEAHEVGVDLTHGSSTFFEEEKKSKV